MRKFTLSFLLVILMVGTKAFAYDFSVKNPDGVVIYYNYINDNLELEVTYKDFYNKYKGDIVIPEEVTYMNRTRKVTAIGNSAFSACTEVTSISIPNSIKSIGNSAIGGTKITNFIIPNNVTTIGTAAFVNCPNLTSINIPNSVESIGDQAFKLCSSLTSITIPSSVKSIGTLAFDKTNITEVISFINEPFVIGPNTLFERTFSDNTFKNATLYVPTGCKEKYKATEGWNDFVYIEEFDNNKTEAEKCAIPTIQYSKGKLIFSCKTEGAICQSTISDSDINSYNSNEITLGVSYNISVYATKNGCLPSEEAKATICWIETAPQIIEDITNITEIHTKAVLIQSKGGVLYVSGIENGTSINVYSVSGTLIGTTKVSNNQASLNTNLNNGDIAIVKIGDKSVKINIQ